MRMNVTPTLRESGENDVFRLLARCTGLDPARLAALVPGCHQTSAVPALVTAGILDRVSARAVSLVLAGSLDERDLKQLLDLPALRMRIQRLAPSANRSLAPTLSPLPLSLESSLGRYRIRGLLGRGALGHVYLSAHPELGTPVAIKVSTDPAPLRSEATVLAKITHPNVVRIWDLEQFGRLTALIQEYVDGGSLGRKLLSGDVIPPAIVLQIARDVLAGLRITHHAGFIHGDVKPANILGPSLGNYKLADFGSAQRIDCSSAPDGIVRGTWPYTAPECFEGFSSPASDVYSLGLTLYHALTGRSPVQVSGFAECRAAHASLNLDPVHWTIPGVSRSASNLVTRMTSRDPVDRPSVSSLLREFRTIRITSNAPLHSEIAR